MELTQQDSLPHIIYILLGIFVRALASSDAILQRRKSRKIFDVAQHDLTLPITELVVCLSSVGATMELKVQLTVPSNELSTVLGFLLESCEEVVNRVTHLDSGKQTSLVAHSSASS